MPDEIPANYEYNINTRRKLYSLLENDIMIADPWEKLTNNRDALSKNLIK